MAAKKHKTSVKKATPSPRTLKKPVYKSFKLGKRIKHTSTPIPKARHILAASLGHLFRHKRLFGGIALVYFLLLLVLVKGLGFGLGSELNEIKAVLQDSTLGQSSALTGATLFGILIGNTGAATSEATGIYQTILFVIVSLALIWALRQTHANAHPKVKDTFYKAMHPLIPFLLVSLVVLLQLLPLAIGNLLYSIVISNGLAVTGLEQFVWAALFGLLALLSLYMLISSIFALYIVTLPDVTPLQALRSARELVKNRRLAIGRKIVFLPVVLALLTIVIMFPILMYITVIAEFLFFVLSVLWLVVMHGYIYELYRKLL